DAGLERVGLDAALLQALRQLFGGEAHPAAHGRVHAVDFGIAHLDSPALAFAHLQFLVDEFVDDVLARGRLLGRQLNELHALLDVERGDRLTIDKDDDVLGRRRYRRCDDKERGGEKLATCDSRFARVNHRHLACVRAVCPESLGSYLANAVIPSLRVEVDGSPVLTVVPPSVRRLSWNTTE